MRNGPSSRSHVPQSTERATETSEGAIPHLRFRGLLCPVLLATKAAPGPKPGRVLDTNWCGTPRPVVAPSGAYYYALPGGYRVDGAQG